MANKLVSVDEADYALPEPVLGRLVSDLSVHYRTVVDARSYGVVANGTTNDAVAFLEAANTAATQGYPLSLPTNATIRLNSRVNLPANLVILGNNCTIRNGSATSDYVLGVSSGTKVLGTLKMSVTTGTQARGMTVTGSDVVFDDLHINATASGAGSASISATGLRITGSSRVDVRRLSMSNWDFPVQVDASEAVRFAGLNISTYKRGLYILNTVNFWLDGGRFTVASPNASVSAGHNAILIEAGSHDATTDLHFTNVLVRDAGEHGIRIGGSRRVKRVWFTDCAAVNVGGCGLKVLGGTTADANYHEDIFIDNFMAEDCGQDVTNCAAVMLQFVRRVSVDNLIVRNATKTYSASHGLDIQAAEDVQINKPNIRGTRIAGYGVYHVLGNSTNVKLSGGLISVTSGNCIDINYTNRTFRRVSVEDFPQIEFSGGGYGVSVTNTSGTGAIVGGSWITWQSVSAASNQLDTGADTTLAGYFCDARAPFTGTPAFKNGSRWIDNSVGTIRNRIGGSWVTQT